MNLTEKEAYKKFLKADYENYAEERYITVSDGSKIRIFTTNAPIENHNGFTFVLVAGWNTVISGWDVVLLEAMKDFDVVYLETREKASSKLAKKTKNNFDRFALDIKETLQQLNIDSQKLVFFGSSFGSAILAHGFGNKLFDSFLNILVAPAIQIDLPPIIRYLIPITPHITMKPVKPIISRWLKKSKSESPEQAAKYIRVMNEAESKKWKNIALHFLYWKWWKVYEKVENDIILVAAESDKMHAAHVTQKISKLMKNSTYFNLETNKNTHTKPVVDLVRELLKKRE